MRNVEYNRVVMCQSEKDNQMQRAEFTFWTNLEGNKRKDQKENSDIGLREE